MEGFPLWVVITHFLNIVWTVLLARSGIEVLSACPKLYWRDDCRPGHEWLRFTRKRFPPSNDPLWSSLEEEESWSPAVALPGRKNLGLGRHWHLLTVQFWIVTGLVYVAFLWIQAIELVPDYHGIGEGQGGWREDHQFYVTEAGI